MGDGELLGAGGIRMGITCGTIATVPLLAVAVQGAAEYRTQILSLGLNVKPTQAALFAQARWQTPTVEPTRASTCTVPAEKSQKPAFVPPEHGTVKKGGRGVGVEEIVDVLVLAAETVLEGVAAGVLGALTVDVALADRVVVGVCVPVSLPV